MSQYPWTSAEGMHQITGEDEEMVTEDKGEDLLPEEMYPLQDTEVPLDVSTVERKDTTHTIAPRRSSHLAMKGTAGKPTSSTYKMKKNRTNAMTTKCTISKKLTQ